MKSVSIILSLVCLALFFSCEIDPQTQEDIREMTEEIPDQLIDSVNITHSEQGIVKIKIKAPTMVLRDRPGEQYNEFPDGLVVTFFDSEGQKTADLDALYGYDNNRKSERLVKDSVVIVTTKGDTIRTRELIMLERKDSIHNNGEYASITRQDGTFLQGYGLFTDNNFETVDLKSVFSSNVPVEGDLLSSPSRPTDSQPRVKKKTRIQQEPRVQDQ